MMVNHVVKHTGHFDMAEPDSFANPLHSISWWNRAMPTQHVSLPELSAKGNLCWEKVLRTYCEFGVQQEYENLSEEGKKTMLTALANSIAQMFAQIKVNSRKATRGKKSLKCSGEDPLVEALLETARNKTVVSAEDEVFDYVRFQFLGSWGVPTSSEMLITEHQVSGFHRHELLAKKGKDKSKSTVEMRTTNHSVQKSSENTSWDVLKPMSISQLKLFQTMKGMRLECKVVGEPHHNVGITTILQDAYGSAVQCGIYNLRGVVDQQSAERVLPNGCTVIIAEPFLKIMMDGKRGIRVDNPAEIHIFLPGCRSLPPAGSIAAGKYQAPQTKAENRAEVQGQNNLAELLDDCKVGQRVRVKGLTSKKGLSLNGRLGVIAAQEKEDLERVTVEIVSDTGKPEVFKIQTGNLEVLEDSSLDEALEVKTKANEAFSRGELDVAVDGYNTVVRQLSSHKTPKGLEELTKCLCNRALCFLKQRKWDPAKCDAELAVELEPANAKAHCRLACAIFQEGEVANQEAINQAAFHTCVALALLPKAEPSMIDLLGAVAAKSAKPVPQQHEIASVSTSSHLSSTLAMQQIKFIVTWAGKSSYSKRFVACHTLVPM